MRLPHRRIGAEEHTRRTLRRKRGNASFHYYVPTAIRLLSWLPFYLLGASTSKTFGRGKKKRGWIGAGPCASFRDAQLAVTHAIIALLVFALPFPCFPFLHVNG